MKKVMFDLPPEKTPLNQHSLGEIELWLVSLGAKRNTDDVCLWSWDMPQWSAEIVIKQDELMIAWCGEDTKSQYSFPYGLPREDVEAALKQGP